MKEAVNFSRIPSIDACFDRFCLSKQEGISIVQTIAKESSFVIDTAIYFLCCRANSLCDNYMYRLVLLRRERHGVGELVNALARP